jgi:hypothetical protein
MNRGDARKLNRSAGTDACKFARVKMTVETYGRIFHRVPRKADGQDGSGLLAWLGRPQQGSVRLHKT